jgi:hypothetical protein
MIEIYVAITQKQLENFESIINYSRNVNKKNRHKILIRDKSFDFNPKLWDQVITSNVLFQQKSGKKLEDFLYMFKKISAYKKIINELDLYRNISQIKIFICYIEDVLSNFLFFNFNKNAEIIVVEDGTLNYYNHSINNLNKLRFYLKKIISFLNGINFKTYKGHSSGAEYDRVSKQFLTFPDAAFIPTKALELPKKQVRISNFSQSLYIVGQDTYIEILNKESYNIEFKHFIKSISQEMNNKSVAKVFYKPRYKISDFEKQTLSSFFKDKEVEIVKNQLNSEEVYFSMLKSKYIASFNSSTMINIYAHLGKDQKHEVEFYFYPIIHSEIVTLFENLGFKNLKL